MRRAVPVGLLMLLALPASADTPQEVWVTFECVTNQAGETLPMYSVEGRPGAEFTVNGEAVGGVLNGGYGQEGENTWTATPLPGFELTSPDSGVVTLNCGGFEAAGGGHPNCERYPWKCQDTTTTTSTTQPTSSTTTAPATTTTPPPSSSTVPTTSASTTTDLATTTTVLTDSTTTTVVATSLTSQPPSSTDPTVAPADAELPDTGLSHDVWAGLAFAGFVALVVGGMLALAGRDDE